VVFSFLRIVARALIRPRLLLILLATGWRFRRQGWFRHPPFLPLPPANYMRWRLHTAYGDEQHVPTVMELEAYARWAARMQKHKRIGDDA
jgi:hypothetical protein